MKCTVVIPTYNERENIEELIQQILGLGPQFSVIVVDDNSPDGTGWLAQQMQQRDGRVRVIHRARKRGLGTAYMEGLTLALAEGADFVAQMDADFSHSPSRLPDLLARAQETGADVVIGTRYAPGGAIRGWPLARHLLSRCGNFYARVVLGGQFTDYTSGFMLHRASVLRELPFCEFGGSNFAFLLEMKVEYARAGARKAEVPIEFVNRVRGASKISLHIVWEAFYIVLHIFRRHGRARAAPREGIVVEAEPRLTATEGPPGE